MIVYTNVENHLFSSLVITLYTRKSNLLCLGSLVISHQLIILMHITYYYTRSSYFSSSVKNQRNALMLMSLCLALNKQYLNNIPTNYKHDN